MNYAISKCTRCVCCDCTKRKCFIVVVSKIIADIVKLSGLMFSNLKK